MNSPWSASRNQTAASESRECLHHDIGAALDKVSGGNEADKNGFCSAQFLALGSAGAMSICTIKYGRVVARINDLDPVCRNPVARRQI